MVVGDGDHGVCVSMPGGGRSFASPRHRWPTHTTTMTGSPLPRLSTPHPLPLVPALAGEGAIGRERESQSPSSWWHGVGMVGASDECSCV